MATAGGGLKLTLPAYPGTGKSVNVTRPAISGATSLAPTSGLLSGTNAATGLKLSSASGLQLPSSTTGILTGTTAPGILSNTAASGFQFPSSTTGASGLLSGTTASGLLSGTTASGLLSGTTASGLFSGTTASGLRLQSNTTTAPGLLPHTTAPSVGLGGLGPQPVTQSQVVSAVDQTVLPQLSELVDKFGQYMTRQKQLSAEISSYTEKCFKTVDRDITTHSKSARVLSMGVHRYEQLLNSLKQDTSQELRAIEVAQRTKELPTSLQHENTAPEEYFTRVVAAIQQKMLTFWSQLEELDAHITAFISLPSVTPDIVRTLQSQHQPFLVFASQLQVVHEQVERLKEQYLSLRRIMLHDSSDVFSVSNEQKKPNVTSELMTGPSPFAVAQATAALTALTTAGGAPQPQVLPQASSFSLPATIGGPVYSAPAVPATNNSLMVGSQSLTSNLTQTGIAKPFQLQKPPLGKKKQLLT